MQPSEKAHAMGDTGSKLLAKRLTSLVQPDETPTAPPNATRRSSKAKPDQGRIRAETVVAAKPTRTTTKTPITTTIIISAGPLACGGAGKGGKGGTLCQVLAPAGPLSRYPLVVACSAGPLVRWSLLRWSAEAGSPACWSAGSPVCRSAGPPVRRSAGPPVRRSAPVRPGPPRSAPVRRSAGSPVRRSAGPPVRRSAGPRVRRSAGRLGR